MYHSFCLDLIDSAKREKERAVDFNINHRNQALRPINKGIHKYLNRDSKENTEVGFENLKFINLILIITIMYYYLRFYLHFCRWAVTINSSVTIMT